MTKEARARILINGLLQRSGWRFFDDENGPANIGLEANVKLKKKSIDALGDDFEKFEDRVKATPEARERYERGDIKGAEDAVVAALFNKPEDFFNLDKLRKALQADRRISLREILAKVFGEIERFKNRDELLEEELSKFVSIHKPDAAHMPVIRQFFKAYVTDGSVRAIVDTRKFGLLADNPKVTLADVKALDDRQGAGPWWRDVIPEYVKDYVPLNTFAA